MMSDGSRIIWGVQIDPELQNTIKTLLIVTGVKSEQIYARKTHRSEYGIDIVK